MCVFLPVFPTRTKFYENMEHSCFAHHWICSTMTGPSRLPIKYVIIQ